MNKRILISLLIILVIAVGYILLMKTISEKAGCDWKPTKDYGPCAMILGVYYNGEKCVWISGCSTMGDKIPFDSMEECKVLCEK